MTAARIRRTVATLALAALVAGLPGCATPPAVPSPAPSPQLDKSSYTSFDGDRLPYRKWLAKHDTATVVIGLHGISGTSADMENLGGHLQKHLPGTSVYAPDLRGQGNDPQEHRRGDIRHPEEWFRDARTFTRLVRARHPGARIIWCGESMGALIALHAAAGTTPPPCHALVISSPVVRIGGDVPAWRLQLLRAAAVIAPRKRVSLEQLSGMDEVKITRGEVHQDQAATNPWHVSRFSLRLLSTLGRLIRTLPDQAGQLDLPVLILHGGKDIFSSPADIQNFAGWFPDNAAVERRFYPESYHLLFYDHEREQVLGDLTRWLADLPEK